MTQNAALNQTTLFENTGFRLLRSLCVVKFNLVLSGEVLLRSLVALHCVCLSRWSARKHSTKRRQSAKEQSEEQLHKRNLLPATGSCEPEKYKES